jgi:hypothetical protein
LERNGSFWTAKTSSPEHPKFIRLLLWMEMDGIIWESEQYGCIERIGELWQKAW